MQVKLITTIVSIIELGPDNSFEKAHEELFGRYLEDIESDDITQEVLERHSEAVASTEDEILATEVTHGFVEVK